MSLIYQPDHTAMTDLLKEIMQEDINSCVARSGLDVDCSDCPYSDTCAPKERIEKIEKVLNLER